MTISPLKALALNLLYILFLNSSVIPPKPHQEYLQTSQISRHDLESALNLAITEGTDSEYNSGFIKYLEKFEMLDKDTERRIYFRIAYAPVNRRSRIKEEGGYKCLIRGIGIIVEDWHKTLIRDREGFYGGSKKELYDGFRVFQTRIDDFGTALDPDGIPNIMCTRVIEETPVGTVFYIGNSKTLDLSLPENMHKAQTIYNKTLLGILRKYRGLDRKA